MQGDDPVSRLVKSNPKKDSRQIISTWQQEKDQQISIDQVTILSSEDPSLVKARLKETDQLINLGLDFEKYKGHEAQLILTSHIISYIIKKAGPDDTPHIINYGIPQLIDALKKSGMKFNQDTIKLVKELVDKTSDNQVHDLIRHGIPEALTTLNRLKKYKGPKSFKLMLTLSSKSNPILYNKLLMYGLPITLKIAGSEKSIEDKSIFEAWSVINNISMLSPPENLELVLKHGLPATIDSIMESNLKVDVGCLHLIENLIKNTNPQFIYYFLHHGIPSSLVALNKSGVKIKKEHLEKAWNLLRPISEDNSIQEIEEIMKNGLPKTLDVLSDNKIIIDIEMLGMIGSIAVKTHPKDRIELLSTSIPNTIEELIKTKVKINRKTMILLVKMAEKTDPCETNKLFGECLLKAAKGFYELKFTLNNNTLNWILNLINKTNPKKVSDLVGNGLPNLLKTLNSSNIPLNKKTCEIIDSLAERTGPDYVEQLIRDSIPVILDGFKAHNLDTNSLTLEFLDSISCKTTKEHVHDLLDSGIPTLLKCFTEAEVKVDLELLEQINFMAERTKPQYVSCIINYGLPAVLNAITESGIKVNISTITESWIQLNQLTKKTDPSHVHSLMTSGLPATISSIKDVKMTFNIDTMRKLNELAENTDQETLVNVLTYGLPNVLKQMISAENALDQATFEKSWIFINRIIKGADMKSTHEILNNSLPSTLKALKSVGKLDLDHFELIVNLSEETDPGYRSGMLKIVPYVIMTLEKTYSEVNKESISESWKRITNLVEGKNPGISSNLLGYGLPSTMENILKTHSEFSMDDILKVGIILFSIAETSRAAHVYNLMREGIPNSVTALNSINVLGNLRSLELLTELAFETNPDHVLKLIKDGFPAAVKSFQEEEIIVDIQMLETLLDLSRMVKAESVNGFIEFIIPTIIKALKETGSKIDKKTIGKAGQIGVEFANSMVEEGYMVQILDYVKSRTPSKRIDMIEYYSGELNETEIREVAELPVIISIEDEKSLSAIPELLNSTGFKQVEVSVIDSMDLKIVKEALNRLNIDRIISSSDKSPDSFCITIHENAGKHLGDIRIYPFNYRREKIEKDSYIMEKIDHFLKKSISPVLKKLLSIMGGASELKTRDITEVPIEKIHSDVIPQYTMSVLKLAHVWGSKTHRFLYE